MYLSFDDGPVPEVTPWVLQQLDIYSAKATFFCLGNNVKQHGDIYNSILEKGHTTGNHTMHHLNAWKTNALVYKEDIAAASVVIKSDLFRPPYGKITPELIRALRNEYKIIMWDVLSKDYDTGLTGADCIDRIKKRARKGSVIVFHDSVKAESRLRKALPAVLEYYSLQGYSFKPLRSDSL